VRGVETSPDLLLPAPAAPTRTKCRRRPAFALL
jgi:hypothetical protein